MRPRLILALFLIAFASVASADAIRFDPPAATAHTSVDAIVSTTAYGCLPVQGGVTIDGTVITLRLNEVVPPHGGCGGDIYFLTSTFHLGVLPPGVYEVVEIVDTSYGSFAEARAKLIVRDDSLTAPPHAVPTTGGEFIVVRARDTTGRVVVTVDGQPATLVGEQSAGSVYLAPPHAAGTVDVTVASASTYRTAVAALTYFDRKAPPDPALFELILFPASFEGPGVFGSHWTTENYIGAGDNGPVRFRDALPCLSCTELLTGAAALRNDQNPAGLALYALRGTAPLLMTESRIRDVSHPDQNGTELPVVRDRDFRDRLVFLSVPVDRHARVMLRAWALTDTPATIGGLAPYQVLRFVPVPGTGLSCGSIDLTSYFQHLPSGTSAYIAFYRDPYSFARVWGLITVTNDDTQQVTIVSSQ